MACLFFCAFPPYNEVLKFYADFTRFLPQVYSVFNRVQLELEGQEETERLFHFGRYLMIAGSREGSEPTNLFGIWSGVFRQRWNGNYTTNINLEMNYWPAEVVNLPECHEPMLRMTEEMSITGWSSSWMICLYARLHNGGMCYDLLEKRKSQLIYENLMDVHPPFQIDGNGGVVAGIAEMLLQSHGEKITILPAVCEQWKNGFFSGFRARGGYEVSASWKNGQIRHLNVVKGKNIIFEKNESILSGFSVDFHELS